MRVLCVRRVGSTAVTPTSFVVHPNWVETLGEEGIRRAVGAADIYVMARVGETPVPIKTWLALTQPAPPAAPPAP